MVKISVGTAGWDYKDWKGTFYPKRLNNRQNLVFYSNFFDIIEINSSFYNLPSNEMVNNWANRVPQNFRFIIKVWQEITHNLGDIEINTRVYKFFQRFEPLKGKILGFLFQFPPRFKYSENHIEKIMNLVNLLPKNTESLYIFELRDDSWFIPENLTGIIDGNKFILGTTYKPGIIPYYLPNQKYYYVRLIGDRELTVFNRIQREQQESLQDLFQNISIFKQKPDIYEIFIIVNNHFQGFAPESANLIKKRLNLSFKPLNQQKSLVEYFK
ncbi:MAG: DUF72 domain-containing protein [Promethearchaeota archaeon]